MIIGCERKCSGPVGAKGSRTQFGPVAAAIGAEKHLIGFGGSIQGVIPAQQCVYSAGGCIYKMILCKQAAGTGTQKKQVQQQIQSAFTSVCFYLFYDHDLTGLPEYYFLAFTEPV
jgi:hypothetical protein